MINHDLIWHVIYVKGISNLRYDFCAAAVLRYLLLFKKKRKNEIKQKDSELMIFEVNSGFGGEWLHN